MYKLLAAIMIIAFSTPASAGFLEFTIKYNIEEDGERRPEVITAYMRKDRFRQDINSPDGNTSFIFRSSPGNRDNYVLFHDTRTYFRNNLPAVTSVAPGNRMQTLPLVESGNVCAALPNTDCRKIGEGNFLNYPVTKWKIKGKRGENTTIWYAPSLGYFLKLDNDKMTITAFQVDERTPPQSLFEIPAGYRETTFADMMRGGMMAPEEDTYSGHEERTIGDDMSDAAGEIGRTAKDTALEEAVEETKSSVRDAIRGIFGR